MTTTSIEKKKQTIADFLTSDMSKKNLQMALPKVGITPDRMIRLMFSALTSTPKLFECTKETLFNAMIQCASLGLECNTQLGHAYLLPFNNRKKNCTDVQLIIGYKGYLSLARRSGELSSISVHVVREGDEFDYQFGTEEFIKHKPVWEDLSKRKIKFAYSVAKLKDGSTSFEIMSIEEIELIRARSKSPDNGPWVTDYEMMCRKTAIRRHMHYLPLSIEVARAVSMDSQNEAGIQDMGGIIDINIEPSYEEKSDDVNESKKTKLEKMVEAENISTQPPKEPIIKDQIQERLGIYFAGDVDAADKFLDYKTNKKTVDSLTDKEAEEFLNCLIEVMGS